MPQSFNSIMELDIATAQHLHKGKNGLHGALAADRDEVILEIPEYFEVCDVRKPPKKWVDDRLNLLLAEIFGVRKNVEKTLSRSELIAYDKMLSQFLTKDSLLPRLRREIEKDFNEMYQVAQLEELSREREYNEY